MLTRLWNANVFMYLMHNIYKYKHSANLIVVCVKYYSYHFRFGSVRKSIPVFGSASYKNASKLI
jgi:hypothetical protein